MKKLTTILATTAWLIRLAACVGNLAVSAPQIFAVEDRPKSIELSLQTRDSSGDQLASALTVNPKNVAVVMVDTWNFHWCITATERCGSFASRFNTALVELRKLGIQIFWCPTDVADQYVGTPQRETAIALSRVSLPPSRNIQFLPIQCFESNHCMCGPGIKCIYDYGWDGLAPALKPTAEDLMPEGTEELYTCCRAQGITHLIYFGFHTNVCTTGKPVGIRAMANAGLQCILARDMTDAISGYDPATNHHPDNNTLEVIATIERQVPTVHIGDELKKLGRWSDEPLNPVRITPWGTPKRPYLFEESTLVSLSAPLNPEARIHYTLDGSEPATSSPPYREPFKVSQSTTIRAVAFDAAGKPCCVASEGLLVKLAPKPPQPTIHLSDLKPIRATCSGFHAFGSKKQPKMDLAYSGQPIKFRDQTFAKGIGIEAPSQLLYALKPDYQRFVGRIGIDETVQDNEMARAVARYPSIVAQVLIDGKVVSESPMLRYQFEPWRFDVPIPVGSRLISLVVTDGGDGNRWDFANWVDAGFVQNTNR